MRPSIPISIKSLVTRNALPGSGATPRKRRSIGKVKISPMPDASRKGRFAFRARGKNLCAKIRVAAVASSRPGDSDQPNSVINAAVHTATIDAPKKKSCAFNQAACQTSSIAHLRYELLQRG
ncbi:hypothetical protein TMPK1_07370 [Rhodospirillales bacterium TMPK1]|uniref:Uncharacterized protein n=1 Tax=Roseiterribacter gracilis TaxID=2812848 RepID=A0A8S8XB72_9PROT|nr:hypothetical protein TMPK1_07370 [Rhodospirillales bacterium TMPK1]